MEAITVKEIKDFKKFVESMEVNIRYELPSTYKYKWIKIEKDADYFSKEDVFTWSMERNYEVMRSVGCIYPLGSSNNVKHWKTEKGAKANLIKEYEWAF